MRIIKSLFALCFFLVFASSCETYKDYEIEYSPVYPLSGEWWVRFTDSSVTPSTTGWFVLSTYNTADNATDKMWIRATSTSTSAANAAYTGRICGKVNCDVAGKTFSGENVVNTYSTATSALTFTITNGSVVLDGAEVPSGKTDKISFTITDSRKPGRTFTVEGHRRTRWDTDEH